MSLDNSFHNMVSYNIQYLQAFVLSRFKDLTSNFLSSDLIPIVIFLSRWSILFLLSSSLLPYPDDLIILLPREVWMRSSGQTKAFQSYNKTFTSLSAWELTVVPVGIRDSRIRISLSNQGGPI
jgi:hypothetical protein